MAPVLSTKCLAIAASLSLSAEKNAILGLQTLSHGDWGTQRGATVTAVVAGEEEGVVPTAYIGAAGAAGEAGSAARAFGALRCDCDCRLGWCACAKCLAGASGSPAAVTKTGHGPHYHSTTHSDRIFD